MKKSEQRAINRQVLSTYNDMARIVRINSMNPDIPYKRLRSCSATVYKLDPYIILKSYNTIIACIDTRTDTLYDFLRYVYGYTTTSAQHIAKFDHDFGADKWGCAHRLTYREV